MSETIVAIHQPNFFPWLGYFDKMNRSDVFIFLDHVQNQKTAGSWSNRVKLLINREGRWVTAPIDRSFSGVRALKDIAFNQKMSWRDKCFRTIEVEYKKSPFYQEVIDVIHPLLMNKEENLATYNIHAITKISSVLGVEDKKLLRSSALNYEGDANEMLVSLCCDVDANVYMCGGGADSYQDEAVFQKAGIELRYQSFEHPVYEQRKAGEFISGLSIIDALMNVGWDGVQELLSVRVKESL